MECRNVIFSQKVFLPYSDSRSFNDLIKWRPFKGDQWCVQHSDLCFIHIGKLFPCKGMLLSALNTNDEPFVHREMFRILWWNSFKYWKGFDVQKSSIYPFHFNIDLKKLTVVKVHLSPFFLVTQAHSFIWRWCFKLVCRLTMKQVSSMFASCVM